MRVLLLVLALVLVGASAEAQSICDPDWLRTASGADVRALIRGGADVNQVCNFPWVAASEAISRRQQRQST